MGIPKKKSRRIIVDGLEYRWLLSFNRDAPLLRLVTIAVELIDSPGTKLIVYPIGVDHNFVDYDRDKPFTPAVVKKFIRQAIEAGWRPTSDSGTFFLGDQHGDPFFDIPTHRIEFWVSNVEID